MSDTLSRKDLTQKHPDKRLWRSFDELEQTPEFREMLTLEFPDAVDTWEDGPSRRNFLKIMGASLALAGVGVGAAGCTKRPKERIVPYVRQPEDLIPGRPLFFATAYTFRGYARGILVESHEGRPTKIEGNDQHPASLGATDAIGQAHVLNLYDPDRSQTVTRTGDVSSWAAFINAIGQDLDARRPQGGRGLYILTESFTSPTLAAQMNVLLKSFPNAKWHQYDAVGFDNTRQGARRAFGGQNVDPVYKFDAANVIVSLDENFLLDLPGSVRYARDFINGRRVRAAAAAAPISAR